MAKWIRVKKGNRCPVCDRDSWCTICPELGLVLCMRVQSDRPSTNEMGGWIHRLGEKRVALPQEKEPERPTIDAASIMQEFWQSTTAKARQEEAATLGVALSALESCRCSWAPANRLRQLHTNAIDPGAWSFPMRDGLGNIIGIRLRWDDGLKKSVTGSRNGLITCPELCRADTLFLLEGPTDLAAALTLGLAAIARPQCQGCIPYTQVAVNRLGASRVVVVADNDTPGLRGARALADELQVPCCTLVLPVKDLRKYLQLGGTKLFLEQLIQPLVWHQPNKRYD